MSQLPRVRVWDRLSRAALARGVPTGHEPLKTPPSLGGPLLSSHTQLLLGPELLPEEASPRGCLRVSQGAQSQRDSAARLHSCPVSPAHTRGAVSPSLEGGGLGDTLPRLKDAHVPNGQPRPWVLRWQRAAAGFSEGSSREETGSAMEDPESVTHTQRS